MQIRERGGGACLAAVEYIHTVRTRKSHRLLRTSVPSDSIVFVCSEPFWAFFAPLAQLENLSQRGLQGVKSKDAGRWIQKACRSCRSCRAKTCAYSTQSGPARSRASDEWQHGKGPRLVAKPKMPSGEACKRNNLCVCTVGIRCAGARRSGPQTAGKLFPHPTPIPQPPCTVCLSSCTPLLLSGALWPVACGLLGHSVDTSTCAFGLSPAHGLPGMAQMPDACQPLCYTLCASF